MKWLRWTAASVFAATLIGCSGSQTPVASNDTGKKKPAEEKKVVAASESKTTHKEDEKGAKAGDHSGWWCAEHGIPEDECSMCSEKVAKECKAKGDWCEKHDRALSQCFHCKPERKEFYAAKYRAKYGKEPPAFTLDSPEKK